MFHRFLFAAVVAGLFAPSAAKADFTLLLSSGGESATVDLNTGTVTYAGGASVSSDFVMVSPGSGSSLVLNATLNNYTISAVLAQNNLPGQQSGATLNLTGIYVVRNSLTGDVVSGTALNNSSLGISLTASGYTFPVPQDVLSTTYSASFTPPPQGQPLLGNITESAYYDATNTPFGTGGPSTSASSNSGGSGIGGVTLSTALPIGTGSFSMTDTISLSGMGIGSNYELASGSISSTVYAPAPSGLILAATMIPFFGLFRRRMSRMVAPTTV